EPGRFVSARVGFASPSAGHVAEPAVVEAVAPGPPPLVAPYVIVKVDPPATVSDDTVIVCPDTETVPELAVVYPAFEPVADGALHPLEIGRATWRVEMPPAAAV